MRCDCGSPDCNVCGPPQGDRCNVCNLFGCDRHRDEHERMEKAWLRMAGKWVMSNAKERGE